MKRTLLSSSLIAGIMVLSAIAMPSAALAQGRGHDGHGRGHDDHGRGHDAHWRGPNEHDRGRGPSNRKVVVQRRVVTRQDTWHRVPNTNSYARSLQRESDHRQQTKNEWRNIAIGAGALSILGALKHDNTLMFAGAAGALYSLNRYEQDRKSQSRTDRLRAQYFNQSYFVRDGHRYDRRLVTRNGQRYYQFYRHG